MTRILIAALACVASVSIVGLTTEAVAQKRVALLIGNSAYKKVSELPNPSRDAAALEKLLRNSGFDFVRRTDNLALSDMRRTLREFSAEVAQADIAVVYFAGHGIEVGGNNYLIPVDAALAQDLDVEDEALPLDRVNQILAPAKRLRLIILDACRDNPFVRSMKRSVASRSIGRGLAKVEDLTTDTLIAYAAKAGSTASDGSGTNSPYAVALLNHLTTPGLDVRLALGRVRDEVMKSTGNQQEPYLYGSLGGAEIALVAGKAGETSKWSEPAPSQRLSEAAEVWDRVKDTSSVSALETYVARYKDSVYAELAKARIADLRKQEAEAAKAVQERQTEERKRAEAETERRKADEEARARADAERRRLALLQQEEQRKRATPGSPGSWEELGCQQVALFGKDREVIRLGRREGRFKAIRLAVRGADVELLNLRVIFANGEPDNLEARHVIRQGERTRPLDLRGWERSIDRVEIAYSTVPNFKALATVCVEGLSG